MPITGQKGLRITETVGRHIIFVPTPKATALRAYLSLNGLSPLHPESVSSDTSSVELHRNTDVKKVQLLLDRWGAPAPRE